MAHTTSLKIPTTMSSFTPDADLELLFDPELILADVKAHIGHDLEVRHCSASTVQHTDPTWMRPLAKTDYTCSHLSVLSFLAVVSDPGVEAYSAAFDKQRPSPSTYLTLVIIHKPADQIVAVGCVLSKNSSEDFVR